jgi:hypothetical protein
MSHMRQTLRVWLLFLIAVTFALPVAAADIVAFVAEPSGLAWRPLVSFEHGTLTISTPDGLVFSREFKTGSGITFNPVGQANYQAPDGTYIWQVVLGQPSAVNAKLRAAAAASRAGDGDPDVDAAHRAASTRATMIQSGAFQILNGAIVPSDLVEPGASSRGAGPRSMTTDVFRKVDWIYDDPTVRQIDFVIADDLIVQGSACIGLDCVNNESFGFDTIRLKENNTRIKFDDTSTATGFPNHDWQLTANDSASGGANKFSIEDITAATVPFTVTGSAPTNSIFVDSTGRVGLRTSTPVLDLHLTTTNTPAHRFEQTNAGGFTAQTWDVAGNEANFFVRDVTGGSRLPFRIRPGAPTSSIDISASGNVGMGTASPTLNLDVFRSSGGPPASSGTTATGMLRLRAGNSTGVFEQGFDGATAAAWLQAHDNTNQAVNYALSLNPNGGSIGIGTLSPTQQLHTTGTVRFAGIACNDVGLKTDASGVVGCISSSREVKHITGDLSPQVALANVMALRPQIGSYKASPDVPEHWLIAEETAAVDRALVGVIDGKPIGIKTQNVVADLIAVVQLQQRRIEDQQRVIEQQQQRLETLERATVGK